MPVMDDELHPWAAPLDPTRPALITQRRHDPKQRSVTIRHLGHGLRTAGGQSSRLGQELTTAPRGKPGHLPQPGRPQQMIPMRMARHGQHASSEPLTNLGGQCRELIGVNSGIDQQTTVRTGHHYRVHAAEAAGRGPAVVADPFHRAPAQAGSNSSSTSATPDSLLGAVTSSTMLSSSGTPSATATE